MSKISQLPAYTVPIDADVIPIEDTTNVVTKKITRQNLLGGAPITDPTIKGINGGNLLAGLFTGWVASTPTFSVASGYNKGNKEFVCTASVDPSSYLSAGMRFKITRGTAPPTQCMAFVAASSQYATKASPAGMSTNWTAFACEAWIYLNSYTNGVNGVVGRRDNTGANGGWDFEITTSGQVKIIYGNAGNFTDFTSYQSLPLKRWVHIAGVITSTASKTGIIYINGVAVPTFNSVNTATSLVQNTTNLSIGSQTTPASGYLDGYLSEVRLWSSSRTSTQIQDNMAINLVGNESNLVGLWQGNGNFNDATTNANNLTATNSAIATQGANPYNSVEYGIVHKVSGTSVTLFCGTDYNIPNMTLNSPYYSPIDKPTGWPSGNKWVVDSIILANLDQGAVASGTTKFLNEQISLPTGDWWGGYDMTFYSKFGSSTTHNEAFDLNTSSATVSGVSLWYKNIYIIAVTEIMNNLISQNPISVSAQTILYLNAKNNSGATTTSFSLEGGFGICQLIFKSAWV